MEMLKRFIKDERGLETVEYAIILGIIVATTITLIITLGGWVHDQFANIVSAINAV
jgi:Flp pilus assembly pilin Flp